MKKALAEVDDQHPMSEADKRLADIEARLAKLDPTPKLETLEPSGWKPGLLHRGC
jgi:hypothetical protein